MTFQLTILTLFLANENKKVRIAIYKFLIQIFSVNSEFTSYQFYLYTVE